MPSRPYVLPRRKPRAKPQADLSASGSVTCSRRRSASSYLTTSGCGTTSAGWCLTAERGLGRQRRLQRSFQQAPVVAVTPNGSFRTDVASTRACEARSAEGNRERGDGDVETSEGSRALTATTSVASEVGLSGGDAIVIQNSNRLAVRLVPCDVLARVAATVGRNQEGAVFELEMARRLEETESPIAVLEPP